MTLTPDQNFIVDLQVLCGRHGASLFFGDNSTNLWIKGEDCGRLADVEDGEGNRFEILEDTIGENERLNYLIDTPGRLSDNAGAGYIFWLYDADGEVCNRTHIVKGRTAREAINAAIRGEFEHPVLTR